MDYFCETYPWPDGIEKIFSVLRDKPGLFFLDSSANTRGMGRYSFIGFDPAFKIVSTDGKDPFLALRDNLRKFRGMVSPITNIPFSCGFCGYLSYDLGMVTQGIVSAPEYDNTLPGAYFGFYDALIAWDRSLRRITIFSSGLPEKKSALRRLRAKKKLRQIVHLLSGLKTRPVDDVDLSPGTSGALRSNFGIEGYRKAVSRAKRYIADGEIYQINLSQRFQAKYNSDAIYLHRRLRKLFPAAFSAYLDCGRFQVVSSSPERFLRLRGDNVVTRPMKGTRPRGKNKRQDALLRRELMLSDKDKAELLMIIDLSRNDLGRVCRYGSIKVSHLRELEKYNTVFQTTGQIEGVLHPDRDGVDLTRACFPGGSITGCPKIRAMQIISQLEPHPRNIYTGSLGYFDVSGNIDFNILIRTLLLKDGQVYFHSGGGIVADSQPGEEYEETLVKARAIIEALL
ncbi:MAG: anthranilate synthase component I family protein [Candidatus Omnitrophota bacterium]